MLKIICVDDSRLGLSSLKRRTRTAAPDADIIPCRSPDEAVKQAKAQGCDVLLTEIGVGRSANSGILLAQQIKEINPRVNIIFITVCSIHEHAAQILPLKISGYITKPYRQEQLTEELAHLRYLVDEISLSPETDFREMELSALQMVSGGLSEYSDRQQDHTGIKNT